MTREILRVANCSGFFGDRQSAAAEMVRVPGLNVITGDWLAELTMTILRNQHARDPLKGYATTFVRQVEEVLGTCLERGIKVVSNAGGVNPQGAAEALSRVADRLGLTPRIGTVSGDDILDRVPALAADGALKSFEGSVAPRQIGKPIVANAYLGGWGIAACLEAGADIVVTGRVTDAALVVGPSVWAFGWETDDWDALAGAVVAGHIIECGTHATGGNYPFFNELGDMRRIGFPIAEIRADGSSVICKHEGTNGAVTVDTVTAQLLYEIQSETYHNPDVSVLLDSVTLHQEDVDRVLVSGVKGTRPPSTLKVSMAVPGGYRNSMTMVLTGRDVEAKVAVAESAVWDLVPGGRSAFDDVDVDLIGTVAEDPKTLGTSMCMLRIAVASKDADLAGRTFSAAVVQTGLSSYPGFFMTGPPGPATAFATFVPALVEASAIQQIAMVDGRGPLTVREPARGFVEPERTDQGNGAPVKFDGPTLRLPLGRLFGARSGDKGGNANLGFWARTPEAFNWLLTEFDADVLASLLPDGERFDIDRVVFPRLRAVNFVVHGWLGAGVSSSLRLDGQAKGLAEYVRARHVEVPTSLITDTVIRPATAPGRQAVNHSVG